MTAARPHPLIQDILEAHGAPPPQDWIDPDSCAAHEFEHDPGAFGMGWHCAHCGGPPDREWLEDYHSESGGLGLFEQGEA